MEVKNNPAGRLHDLLSAARHQNPRENARKAWAAVFGIEPDDTGTLLKMLADLIDLAHETKVSIQRLDDVNHQLHLKPFKKIEALLSQLNLEASWESSMNYLDEPTLYGLQFSADRLSRASGFTQIGNDDILSLRKQIEELVNSVVDSSLPQELKLLLLRNLEAIRHALLAYRVRGIEGLQEEVERSVGSILLHRSDIVASKDKPEEQKVWQSFFKVIEQLNKLVSLARNTKELAAPALQAISQFFN